MSEATSFRPLSLNAASSIYTGVEMDAMPRRVTDRESNSGGAIGASRQLLPPITDSRVATFGQRELGPYKEYKPPTQIPSFRRNRVEPERAEPQTSTGEPIPIPARAAGQEATANASPAAGTISNGLQLDRAPAELLVTSIKRMSLADSRPIALVPSPRQISNSDDRQAQVAPRAFESEPLRKPTQTPIAEVEVAPIAAESTNEAAVEHKYESDVVAKPELSPVQSQVELDERDGLENSCASAAESRVQCEVLATGGDSGCVADALEREFECALPIPEALPATTCSLDSETTETLLADRSRIMSGLEEGTVDQTLFTEVDEDGDSELHKALFLPHEYCNELPLLVAGSERSQLARANRRGVTPLMAAVEYCAPVPIVRALRILTCGFALETGPLGYTPTHYAAAGGRSELIGVLLAAPTDVEARFVLEFDASDARTSGSQQQTTQNRIEALAEQKFAWTKWAARAVNATNALQETPLYLACKSSHVETARRLLHYGADPRIQEATDSRSALHEAVLLQSSQLVQVLLDEIQPSMLQDLLQLETRNEETALDLAYRVQPATRAQAHERERIIALLERAQDEANKCTIASNKVESLQDLEETTTWTL